MVTRSPKRPAATPPEAGPPPRYAVAVDVVLLALRDERLSLLLVRRGVEPFRGRWALPGGFVLERESLDAAAARELAEEAGVTRVRLDQFGVYGDPERDPRGRVISVAYVALIRADDHVLRAATDADAAAWFPLDDPPALAFDHARIVADARAHLRAALDREAVGIELLPEAFSLAALQRVHEAVLGHALDKRNFRRKVLADGLVEPIDGEREEGAGRPAQLFRYAGARRAGR